MTGAGDEPRDLRDFIIDSRRRLVALERRQATAGGGDGGGSGESVFAPGLVASWSGSPATIPSGWLLCDGRAVMRAAFPALFAAIGTTYGVGDGTTTFNLPNGKGRVIVGQDTAQVEFDVVGEVGGAKTHTLTVAQMPAHAHAQSVTAPQGGGASRHDWNGDAASSAYPQGVNTGDTGGGQAHNNLQPYLVQNWIISTGAGSTPPVAAVLPVDLWQEFSLVAPGGLRPVVGGKVAWDATTGNLGATLSADRTTITVPSAGTYRIITHLGLAANPGVGVETNTEWAGQGISHTLDFGNAGAAGVYVSDVEWVGIATGPTSLRQAIVTAPNGLYDWTWMRVEKLEPFYPTSPVLAVTQGSTALRDSIYGVPATDAARASLANRAISWFNTDKGWFESYYALSTIAGVNTGRKSNASGWLPLGGGNTPVCSMCRNAAFSIPNGGWTPVAWNFVYSNPYMMWTSATPTRITVPIAGSYQINVAGATVATTGRQGLVVRINGVDFFGNLNAAGSEVGGSASNIIDLNAGDYIEMAMYQESSTGANTSTSGYARPFISVKYLGPVVIG